MVFLILFTISSIIMYVLDGLIAFFIPAKRVRKTLLDPDNIKLLTKEYGKGVYEGVRETVKKDVDAILTQLSNRVDSTVTNNIRVVNDNVNRKLETLCTNDLPHVIDQKTEPIMAQLNQVQGWLNRAFSSAGVNVRTEKANERKQLMAFVIANSKNPEFQAIALNKLKQNIDVQTFDMILGQLAQKTQKQLTEGDQHGTLEEMSILQGNAPQEAGLREVQEIPQNRNVGEMSISEQAAKDQLFKLAEQDGIDPKLLIEAKKKGEMNKCQEKETETEDRERNISESPPPQSE